MLRIDIVILLPATVGQHVTPGGGGTGGVQPNLPYQEHIDDRVKDGVVHGVVDVAILVIVLPPATRICRLHVHVHCIALGAMLCLVCTGRNHL